MYRNTFLSVMFLACCFMVVFVHKVMHKFMKGLVMQRLILFQTHLQLRHLIILIILISALMVFLCKRRRSSGKWLFWKMIM